MKPRIIEIVHRDGLKRRRRRVVRTVAIEGIEFAVHRPWKLEPYFEWAVSDFVTGAQLAVGMTIDDAIESARYRAFLHSCGPGGFADQLAKARARFRRKIRGAKRATV